MLSSESLPKEPPKTLASRASLVDHKFSWPQYDQQGLDSSQSISLGWWAFIALVLWEVG